VTQQLLLLLVSQPSDLRRGSPETEVEIRATFEKE